MTVSKQTYKLIAANSSYNSFITNILSQFSGKSGNNFITEIMSICIINIFKIIYIHYSKIKSSSVIKSVSLGKCINNRFRYSLFIKKSCSRIFVYIIIIKYGLCINSSANFVDETDNEHVNRAFSHCLAPEIEQICSCATRHKRRLECR